MNQNLITILIFLLIITFVDAQSIESTYLKENYNMEEYHIPMRDGVELFTIVYTPKERGEYPILLNRTCYNASRMANYSYNGYPSKFLVKDKYILAFQDVRGRYMSDGKFDNMTPNIPGNNPKNKKDIDESSDTYDSIDWMLKKLKGNNGKVGMYGISYPGFYTAAALADAHPALKASSPQAPISDFFFDDFHHQGAYLQSYTAAFAVFGYQKEGRTREAWYNNKYEVFFKDSIGDGYDFHLRLGPLKSITEKYHKDNFFWNQIISHPNYDEFWQKRNILPHLGGVNHAVMTVGGWFDAEDLYGPLSIYKSIEKLSPNATNTIVMGPWAHGDWAREKGKSTHNHIYFGDSLSTIFQREVEAKFFAHHLKGEGKDKLPEAHMYDTGTKEWKSFEEWPPNNVDRLSLSFAENGKLIINGEKNEKVVFDYVSDPMKPVPYTSETEGVTFTPRKFMSDDQRGASHRPDVLTFESEVLKESQTIAGEIMAKLKVAISGTDADFIVKLIDVYPQDHPSYDHNPKNVEMGGYQQLVRSEVFRGRFRNSFEKPEPFIAKQTSDVNFQLQDVLHTFKPGHRIMIQIHSTWFPYIDRNPQKYVENIYEAKEEDFIKSTIQVYGSSSVEVGGKQVNLSPSPIPMMNGEKMKD